MYLWLWWFVALACNPPVALKPDPSMVDKDGDGFNETQDCDDADPLTGSASSWFLDEDEDGFGAGEPVVLCVPEEGYVADGTDCNDNDRTIHPGTFEFCDLIDNNCDGEVDEDAVDAVVSFVDADGDFFGDPLTGLVVCEVPSGRVTQADDCDDGDGEVHPLADEVCDGLDNDCSGSADDEALDASIWFVDADGDGYGNSSAYTMACEPPVDHVALDGDCDDSSDAVYPGATDDWYDGIDANCDGVDDYDQDQDGFLSGAHGGEDCNDWDAAIHPGAFDWIDGLDNNCTGDVDVMDVTDANGSVATNPHAWPRRDFSYGVGDINGDGLADIALSSGYRSSTLTTNTGAMRVFFGPIGGTSDSPLPWDSGDIVFHGDSAQDAYELTATVIGEPGGGSPWAIAIGNQAYPGGGVYVFSSPQPGYHPLTSATGVMYIGGQGRVEAPGCMFGHQITTLGAFDADPTPNWAVVELRGSDSAPQSGSVYVVSGIPSGTSYFHLDAQAKLVGESENDQVGYGMARLRDVDGDGLSELAVSSSRRTENGELGKVYVIQGPVSGTVSLSDADLQIYGTETYASAGRSIADAGDVDGDGLSDLLVGAVDRVIVPPSGRVTGPGMVALFYSPVLGFRIRRPNPFTRFSVETAGGVMTGFSSSLALGSDVAGAGDFDGDGYDDFSVSGLHPRGWLVTEQVVGWHDIDQIAAVEFSGARSMIRGVGDINGDGFPDLMAASSSQVWTYHGGL